MSKARPSTEIQLITLIGLFVYRLINAQFVQTFFQPDEFFQALEPAWQWAFGPSSGAWITWEWAEQLRSSIHPLLFAMGYRSADQVALILRANHQLRARILLAAPRIMQAAFAAAMDLSTWRMAIKIFDSRTPAASAALILTVCSPWQWFCSTRTFANSLEATCTIVALDLFPWSWFIESTNTKQIDRKHPSLVPSLIAAAIAFVLRPTNIIIWAAISACLVLRFWSSHKALALVGNAVLCGCGVLAATSSIDRTFYGEWTFPPLRFAYFNVVQSLSVFYGRNRPDYYLTEGLPLLMTTALPFGLVGFWQSIRQSHVDRQNKVDVGGQTRFIFSMAIVTYVSVLSCLSHKEARFLYPLLPILHILAAGPFTELIKPRSVRLAVLALWLALNVCIAGYVSLIHQRGAMDTVHYMRHMQESWMTALSREDLPFVANPNVTVGFFMPCHSTPWRSHFVYPELEAWALTCEPPINLTHEERLNYLDEADIFYADPAAWIEANMEDRATISEAADGSTRHDNGKRKWPNYLVFFEPLLSVMDEVLDGTRYRECRRLFNSHWHDDRRRQGDIIVWCMRKSDPSENSEKH